MRKDYFNNMKISKKLTVGFGLAMSLMLLVAIVSIIGIIALNSSIKRLVNGADAANEAIKDCRIDVNVAARSVREMALNTDETKNATYKAKVEEMLSDTDTQLKIIKSTGVISDEKYQSYVDALTAWANDAYGIVEDIENGDKDEAIEKIFNNCLPALDNLVALALEIDGEIESAVNSSVATSQTVFIICVCLIIAISVLSIVFALYISKLITASITKPLEEIEGCAKELANGNLHTNLTVHSQDELGDLAHSLRKAIETLSSYIDDLSRGMGEFAKGNFDVQPESEWKGDFVNILDAFLAFEKNMADTIHGIQKVAFQVETGAEQVSATSMELAQGATDQASVMQEFTATIETVSDQVSSNAKYAKNISKQVESVGGEITATTDKMTDMVNSMNEIEKSSQQIRKIIDTINDVATQTNLLALNASIEAARAGESGRGFAVVANQVTALAAQTAAAAKESTELIENSIIEVTRGMQITEDISKQQQSVAQNTMNIVEEVNKVAETLSSQKDAFVQLNEGVNQINDVVQTNSATSQQCAANSQEMNSQADSLGKLISKFKVAENA
jgi:methyl-accepting chemotaxis protein